MLTLPVEIIEMIIKYTNNFYLIEHFEEFLSNSSIRYLLKKSKCIYNVARQGDFKGLKIHVNFTENYTPERVLSWAVHSNNKIFYEYCYELLYDNCNNRKELFAFKKSCDDRIKRRRLKLHIKYKNSPF